MITVRNYNPRDYESLATLYKQSSLYGGQFDANRDSKERLAEKIKADPDAILIAELDGKIIGTVSLIEDGRVAWLFRFAVLENDTASGAIKLLYEHAAKILKSRGHNQVLVYAPAGNMDFQKRYEELLSFEKGGDYTCYFKDI